MAFLGTALQAGNVWAEVFVWPTLARVAPNMMSGQATGAPVYLMMGIFLSGLISSIGIILFGVATFMARVYPRWAALLLIVSIPLTMFLDPTQGTFQESIGQILFGIAVAALGFYALRIAPSHTSSKRRA